MYRNLIILTLSLLCSFFSVANDGKVPVVIKGNVTDSNSGAVIQGATVTIEHNGQVIQSIQTDDQGNFSLRYEGNTSRPDQLKVSVYKNGYTLKKCKSLNQEKNEIRIKLKKKPPFQPFLLPSSQRLNYNI